MTCHDSVPFVENDSHEGTTPHRMAFPPECRETCCEDPSNMRHTMSQYGSDWNRFGEGGDIFEGLLNAVRMSVQC